MSTFKLLIVNFDLLTYKLADISIVSIDIHACKYMEYIDYIF